VVVDAHRLDDETPYLFKTTDLGRTWTRLTAGLDPEIYLHVVREDTRRRRMLYLGTERGVMVSHDDGASWSSLRLNMPTVSVVDLVVAGDDLVVGTLGRSAWILDDLTPVREMSPEIAAAPAHLFPVLPAIQWHYASAPYSSREGAGDNPPVGAIITYSLATKPEGEVSLEIFDGGGKLVHRLSSALKPQFDPPGHPDADPDSEPEPELEVEPGTHQASWDLTWEAPRWPPGARSDNGQVKSGPLALPGNYTVKLTVGGSSQMQTVRVEADPRSTTSISDLEAQLTFNLEVRDRLNRIVDMVETIRSVRDQVKNRNTLLTSDPQAVPLIELGKRLISGLGGVEEAIHSPQSEVDYDILAGRQGGAKLYSRLAWLLMGADAHDGPPTQGMLEVGAELAGELAIQEAALDALLSSQLAELNAMAAELAIPCVLAPVLDRH
jgi:hypothetical protein